jgi:NAD(P)-dependent dehydrogenase (short-subunit alcohol dehydrogenase family)
MDTKKFFIVGGSSGIGLEIVKALRENGNEIYVGSRTNDQLAGLGRVHHFALDVKAEEWFTVRAPFGSSPFSV